MITQVSKWGQKEALGKGVEVVVATPGRQGCGLPDTAPGLEKVSPCGRAGAGLNPG